MSAIKQTIQQNLDRNLDRNITQKDSLPMAIVSGENIYIAYPTGFVSAIKKSSADSFKTKQLLAGCYFWAVISGLLFLGCYFWAVISGAILRHSNSTKCTKCKTYKTNYKTNNFGLTL